MFLFGMLSIAFLTTVGLSEEAYLSYAETSKHMVDNFGRDGKYSFNDGNRASLVLKFEPCEIYEPKVLVSKAEE